MTQTRTPSPWPSEIFQQLKDLRKDSTRKGGFEPIPNGPKGLVPCPSPQHNPPTHLCIPSGMQYRHICPVCGREQVLRSPTFYC